MQIKHPGRWTFKEIKHEDRFVWHGRELEENKLQHLSTDYSRKIWCSHDSEGVSVGLLGSQ
jgi:hypothetical protein